MMKQKIDKETIWLMILIPVVMLLMFVLANKFGEQYPAYSVLNKSEEGYSIFYQTLKELDYPVTRTLQPITDYDPATVQIITKQRFSKSIEEQPGVEDWVKKGGVIVALRPQEEQFSVEMKEGLLIKANTASLTNNTLLEETDKAYELLGRLAEYDYEIYFNESNLFATDSKQNLWGVIPLGIKVILYQLVIVLIAFFYYQGKRFGKPKALHSEVERIENEYIYSAAFLYRQAKCWDLLVEYYYQDFLKTAASTHQRWLKDWSKNDLPALNKAIEVYQFMEQLKKNPKKNLKEKRCVKLITTLQELKKIINKRRDNYWKRLKQNT